MNKLLKCKLIFEKQKVYLITLGLLFLSGLLVGIILSSSEERILYSENIYNFLLISLSKNGSVFKLFLFRILNLVGFFLFFAITGISLYTLFPFHSILIVYRGYVLGVSAVVFIANYAITGAVIYIFSIFLQNVITTASLICYSAFCYNRIKSLNGCEFNFKRHFEDGLICLCLALLGVVLELLLISFILRPLNIYF